MILSGDIEILAPADEQAPAGGEVERLSATFAASAEQVPATNHRIELRGHGRVVGTVELFTVGQGGDAHLVVGGQEWFRPEHLGEADSRAHFAAVADRLMDEAVALAERLGLSLSTVTPGSLATADRLAARGFRQSGDLWYRGRPAPRGKWNPLAFGIGGGA